MGGLFGGNSKVQETTTEAKPWREQAPYLKELFRDAAELKKTPLAGATAAERQAARGFQEYARGALPQYVQQVREANEYLLNPAILSPQSNPALGQYMDAVTQRIMQGLTESALPAVASGAAATGNIGSSRQGIAEALATQRALQQVGLATSGLANQAYGQGLQAMLGAQQLAPMVAQLGTAPAEMLAQSGVYQRQLDNLEYANERQRLADYQALIGGSFGGTTTAQTPYETGGVTGALGGASMAAGGLAAAKLAGLAVSNPVGWGIIGIGALLGAMS